MHRQHEHSTPDHLQHKGHPRSLTRSPHILETAAINHSSQSFPPHRPIAVVSNSAFEIHSVLTVRSPGCSPRPPCMGLAHVPEYRGVPTPTGSRTPTESAQPQSVPHRAHSAKTHPQSIMHCKGIRVPTCPAREYPAGPASIPRCRSEPTPRVLSCIFLHHNKGPRSHTAKERCEAKQQIHHNKNHCRNSSPP